MAAIGLRVGMLLENGINVNDIKGWIPLVIWQGNHAFPGCVSLSEMVCSATKREQNMATAIKAIPTLRGREAKEFLRHAAAVERRCAKVPNRNGHPSCRLAHAILDKAGMLK